jgi:Polysaccharide lyase
MTSFVESAGRKAVVCGLMVTLSVIALAWLSLSPALAATAPASLSAGLSFDGSFQSGLAPWGAAGGGAQCANYGTPSTAPRVRGNLYDDSSTFVAGVQAARFDLPASQPNYPLQACELTNPRPLGLGGDDYYGYMFYVPQGWSAGVTDPSAFWGIATAQFHFQGIWGSPIAFELHDDRMTLALETGACSNSLTSDPGCQWRSNADNPDGDPGNLGAHYVVPAPMQQGVWHEIVMHVRWASDSTGQIQVWHRVMGDSDWTQTVNLSGYPTVQWDASQGCCYADVVDKVGAYRGPSTVPVSVWESNVLIGTSFGAVAGSLPIAPGTPATVGIGVTSPTKSPARKRAVPRKAKAPRGKATLTKKELAARKIRAARSSRAVHGPCARVSARIARPKLSRSQRGRHAPSNRRGRRHAVRCAASRLRA